LPKVLTAGRSAATLLMLAYPGGNVIRFVPLHHEVPLILNIGDFIAPSAKLGANGDVWISDPRVG
jgi:hypothetical protein